MSTNVTLGTLQPGDTVSYIYQLTGAPRTAGSRELWPSSAIRCVSDVTTGNLVLTSASVPEPATWMLSVIGLLSSSWCSAAVGHGTWGEDLRKDRHAFQ